MILLYLIKIFIYLIFLIFFLFLLLRLKILEFNYFNLKYINKIEIECGIFGYINKNSNSINYLLFLLVFLIFDLEIILLLSPILYYLNFIILWIFLMINIRLVLELFELSLKWND